MKAYQIQTDQYNVIYKTPGKSDRSAMPLGNGRVGISVWVEEDGDLQFYIGHSDAQSEMDRNIKLGKIILHLEPNPFTADADFTQQLVLRKGCVEIEAKSKENTVRARVFVDAEADRIYAELESEKPVEASARLLCWRTGEKAPWRIPDVESKTGEWIRETADRVYSKDDGIVFFHKNGKTCVRSTAIIEALPDDMDKIPDTLENRTFGGYFTLSGGKAQGSKAVAACAAKKRHTLAVSIFCSQEANTPEMIEQVIALHKEAPAAEFAAGRTAKYWDEYFGRSYIFINGDKEAAAPVPDAIAGVSAEPDDRQAMPSKVTQSYILTKFMFACTGRGKIPIHFNGMIFNLMPGLGRHLDFEDFCRIFSARPAGDPDLEINPDEKGWESCIHLWQNIRLPYAAMLERGEFEPVRTLFAHYRRFWDINRVKARVYYDAEGQYNTEMTNTFGLQPISVYGADRTGLRDGYSVNRSGGAVDLSPGLELCSMMLDYYNYTRDIGFLKEEILPYAQELLHFIETRFKERRDGKIHLTELQCVETYFDTVNPIPVVAGMHAVTDRILSFSQELVGDRSFFEKFQAILPAMPLERDDEGNTVLAPAERYEDRRMNVESPAFYLVYPFRLFTHYKGNRKIMRDTFRFSNKISNCFRPHRHGWPVGSASYSGWQYIGMVTALMGMTAETEEILVNNCALKNPGTRFPAMWGPIYDAVPDGDHGANVTNTLQLMAMQSEEDQIYVLPAWPRHWDVSFRLFAGNDTVVELEYRAGRIERLEVTPETRRKDVVIVLPEDGKEL